SGLNGSDGATGPSGPSGPVGRDGSPGASGPSGPPGISGLEVVTDAGAVIPPGQDGFDDVQCPTGKKILGGGFSKSADLQIRENHPIGSSGWTAGGRNESSADTMVVNAYAICANAS